jgi:hypothetical protein
MFLNELLTNKKEKQKRVRETRRKTRNKSIEKKSIKKLAEKPIKKTSKKNDDPLLKEQLNCFAEIIADHLIQDYYEHI